MHLKNVQKLSVMHAADIDVLFIAANNSGQSSQGEAHVRYHRRLVQILRQLGLRVTVTSDLSALLSVPPQKYIYGIHSHAWFNGKEVFTSALAEYHGRAYLGPKPTVRALTEDKKLTRIFAQGLEIPVPDQAEISVSQLAEDFSVLPRGPWITKPRNGIASQFVTFCRTPGEISDALAVFNDEKGENPTLLVETFVPGINISVPIIEGFEVSAMPMFQEWDDNEQNILTFVGKRGKSGGYRSEQYLGAQKTLIAQYAQVLEGALRPYDYGRLDFRCNQESGEVFFLEANLICNISEKTVIAKSAALLSIEYKELIQHIISTSFKRQFGA